MMDIYDFFAEHNIDYQRQDHPAVFTVEEALRLVPPLPGAKTKNLFLRDRKGRRHILVVVGHRKVIDLKALSNLLQSSPLSLASPRRLKQYLNVDPGSVSTLSIFNDVEQKVEVIIDRELWNAKAFQCHPLVNTSTLVISKKDLERFFEITGHEIRLLHIPDKN
jgi:Ala-tRNA(Pro) deacylase